jgi:hypothetical protein
MEETGMGDRSADLNNFLQTLVESLPSDIVSEHLAKRPLRNARVRRINASENDNNDHSNR